MRIKVDNDFVERDNEKFEKKNYVKEMFSDIADKYNFFNDVISFGMHRSWKNFVVQQANLKYGDKALDICTGTGDIAFKMVKVVGESGYVEGLDFVDKMINLANKRNTKYNNLNFQVGDALNLPFDDNSFDAVTVGYGLRNVIDIPKAIREMKRVAKPGGRIISIDLGKPTMPVYKDFYYFYFYQIMPRITALFQGKKEAYSYLPNSLDEFPAQKGLVKIMHSEELKSIKCFEFAGGSVAVHFGVKA